MRDLKGFARAQSIFIELVVKDVNLSSVPVNPGPSDKSPPESAIIPPLGLKVADQRVSGDFEVGYVRESKPIVMLDPRSTVVGGFKLNLSQLRNSSTKILAMGLN